MIGSFLGAGGVVGGLAGAGGGTDGGNLNRSAEVDFCPGVIKLSSIGLDDGGKDEVGFWLGIFSGINFISFKLSTIDKTL